MHKTFLKTDVFTNLKSTPDPSVSCYPLPLWPNYYFFMIKKIISNKSIGIVLLLFHFLGASAQKHSVSREWNEALLSAIRLDLARPTVHSRNLFHHSLGMYEAFAAISDSADHIFLGRTFGHKTTAFDGFQPADSDSVALDKSHQSFFIWPVKSSFWCGE